MFFKRKKKSVGNSNRPGMVPHGEPSYIGRDVSIEGHVNCDGELHIDGTVRGTVRAQLCVIDAGGIVQGEVSGEIVHVRGRVIGPIQGNNVFIYNGAHVEGEVYHNTISIENGAYVYGVIRHNEAPAPSAPAATPPKLATTKSPIEQADSRIVNFKQ